jgi:AraC-like DNA-binding protein
LLAETELKVAAVAENCGFTQAKYFCQVFRRRFGITPAAFRRETQGRKNYAGPLPPLEGGGDRAAWSASST